MLWVGIRDQAQPGLDVLELSAASEDSVPRVLCVCWGRAGTHSVSRKDDFGELSW